MRTFLIVILVLAFLVPDISAKGRRGANIVVKKKDGTVVKGELLAVKGENLIIMDEQTSSGITESLMDILSVKVVKETKLLKGIGLGFLFSGLVGAGIGAATGKRNPDLNQWTPGQGALGGAVLFGCVGTAIGGIVSAIAGIDQTIKIIPREIPRAAAQLRRVARDRS